MRIDLLCYLRLLVFLLVAIELGFFGLSLVFSDLGQGENVGPADHVDHAMPHDQRFGLGFASPKHWRLAGVDGVRC